jgi:hypothetical protein
MQPFVSTKVLRECCDKEQTRLQIASATQAAQRSPIVIAMPIITLRQRRKCPP